MAQYFDAFSVFAFLLLGSHVLIGQPGPQCWHLRRASFGWIFEEVFAGGEHISRMFVGH